MYTYLAICYPFVRSFRTWAPAKTRPIVYVGEREFEWTVQKVWSSISH